MLRVKVITVYNHVCEGINGFVSSWSSYMMQSSPMAATARTDEIPPPIAHELQWGGEVATALELASIKLLRETISSGAQHGKAVSRCELMDVELLRFLRHHHGDTTSALLSVQAHMTWKASLRSIEETARRKLLLHSPLQEEIFWLGVNKENCATLVIRTQLHDGSYFDEDPALFERYVQ
jgi:hypothetical protein